MAADQDPVKVWPLWGRVLFWVLLGLVLVGAFYEAFRGGSINGAAVRVAVIVVAVPGLALLLVTFVLRGRVSRSTGRLAPQIAEAADEVRAEQGRAPEQRASGASDDSLRTAAESLADAQRRLAATDVNGAVTILESLRGTSSPWRSSPLSKAVADCLRSARRVRRTTEALDRQRR